MRNLIVRIVLVAMHNLHLLLAITLSPIEAVDLFPCLFVFDKKKKKNEKEEVRI